MYPGSYRLVCQFYCYQVAEIAKIHYVQAHCTCISLRYNSCGLDNQHCTIISKVVLILPTHARRHEVWYLQLWFKSIGQSLNVLIYAYHLLQICSFANHSGNIDNRLKKASKQRITYVIFILQYSNVLNTHCIWNIESKYCCKVVFLGNPQPICISIDRLNSNIHVPIF